MSDLIFPSCGSTGTQLPGVFVEGPIPICDTTVQGARTGPEYRVSESVVRYRYVLTVELRGWLAEHTTLFDFFVARRGRLDSFLFTDPRDGVVRRVRFDDDELNVRPQRGGVWAGTFDLVTVVG